MQHHIYQHGPAASRWQPATTPTNAAFEPLIMLATSYPILLAGKLRDYQRRHTLDNLEMARLLCLPDEQDFLLLCLCSRPIGHAVLPQAYMNMVARLQHTLPFDISMLNKMLCDGEIQLRWEQRGGELELQTLGCRALLRPEPDGYAYMVYEHHGLITWQGHAPELAPAQQLCENILRMLLLGHNLLEQELIERIDHDRHDLSMLVQLAQRQPQLLAGKLEAFRSYHGLESEDFMSWLGIYRRFQLQLLCLSRLPRSADEQLSIPCDRQRLQQVIEFNS